MEIPPLDLEPEWRELLLETARSLEQNGVAVFLVADANDLALRLRFGGDECHGRRDEKTGVDSNETSHELLPSSGSSIVFTPLFLSSI
jgi:hypothetical protein